MKKWLLLFLLIPIICFAQDKVEIIKSGGKDSYKDKSGKIYQTIEIPLVSTYSYKKPIIGETKILTKDEQDVVEFSLKENGRKLVHKELRHAKNDYKNDFDRGTVEYTPKCRNYSFHKVVIPDGTVIKESNFTQKEPFTQAIEGKNLTFIDCNLVNIKRDTTWILQGSNNTQIKRIKKREEDLGGGKKKIIISHQVIDNEQKGIFTEVTEDEEITDNVDSYALAILRLNK